MDMDPRLNELLHRRADLYRHRGALGPSGAAVDYLCFRVGVLDCGFRLSDVVSLLAMPELTGVPNMPSTYLGLFATRGTLHEAFSLPLLMHEANPEHSAMVLVQTGRGSVLGLAVSQILGIREFNPELEEVVDDPNWSPFLKKKVSKNVYLVDTEVLIKQLSNA